MTVSDQEVLDAESRARSAARIQKIRDDMLAEQEAHRATMALEADKSRVELDIYMTDLTKGEQRLVRMHALLQFLNGDMSDVSNRQVAVDLIALRLARYMVTGEAK